VAEPTFLDTNIVLRHLLADHLDHSPRATALIHAIERGEVQVRTADTVIFEVVFVLERTLKRPKSLIREGIERLIELPAVDLPGKHTVRRALELYVDANIPFADAYHAALMEDLNLTRVYSFDHHFPRLPGIERVEP